MVMYKKRELWTYFFEKPKKYYNKYMYEMPNYPEYLIFDKEEIVNNKNKWNKVFKNNNEIHFEIGSGSGNFSIQMANENKNINLLCDELRLKRLVTAAKKAKRDNLDNIKFIKYDANKLQDILGENEIDVLYINFPDPWEGAEEKRMLGENLLNSLKTILKPGGKIYFKTDHTNYYESVKKLIESREDYKILNFTDDLYNSPFISKNVQTEFEHLFIHKLKINIKYIEIIKK